MTDRLSKVARSENMRRIRGKDTLPELVVRRLIHRLGYRYRLHQADLAGKPDLVFPARKKVIFVHGCFWHQHSDCAAGRVPHANNHYWAPKLARNVARDTAHATALHAAGWEVLVIWECETRGNDLSKLAEHIAAFLE